MIAITDEVEDRFPISTEDSLRIDQVIVLIRSSLRTMTPGDLRTAAAVLLALERLPASTPGVDVVFGFSQPNRNGNYGWADIAISVEELRFGVGEHFYDPAVGGDTESRTVFEALIGEATSNGDIDDWLPVASVMAQEGGVSAEDFSDYDEIDWDAPHSEPEG